MNARITIQRLLIGAAAALLVACSSEAGDQTVCGDGTIRDGYTCIPDPNWDPDDVGAGGDAAMDAGDGTDAGGGTDGGAGVDTGGTADAGGGDTGGGTDTGGVDTGGTDTGGDAGPVDVGGEDAGEITAPTAIPFAVDDHYFASGWMGGLETLAAPDECPRRAGSESGICHQFTWSPGASALWVGVYWQFPEENWGTLPSHTIPAGATEIAFYAWGASGGERVNFLSGIAEHDGYARESGYQVLTAEPTEYTISLDGVTYDQVVGPFGWVSDQGTSFSFFIDDIRWR